MILKHAVLDGTSKTTEYAGKETIAILITVTLKRRV
jgi:hypothetical protein